MKTTLTDKELHTLCANTLRFLSIDAVEKSNSGHPGMPMGAADYSWVLWSQFLRFSVKHPAWANRDRFVLSAGHGSMLLYSLLHVSGHQVTLDDIKNFRQWGSCTPGHPEYGHTHGVEATTGPLGQGFANAVGIGLAAKMMAARFNRPDFSPIDHHVWSVVSDGDLMEGVTSEAASLAGHLGLDNLIFIYDDNKISIDGDTKNTFSEDVAKRFEAYGWNTIAIDGHDVDQINQSFIRAKNSKGKPTLILARTHIGFGSPKKQDSSKAHGEPLGKDETISTRKALGWPEDKTFYVPEEVLSVFQKRNEALDAEYQVWEKKFSQWKTKHPELAKQWDEQWNGSDVTATFDEASKTLPAMPDATRSVSAKLQQSIGKHIPAMVAGSADLAGSTKAIFQDATYVSKEDFSGRNIHFGIREHAMGSISNGMALYGSFVPVTSTFLVFSDYMRPAIRVAALSKLQNIFVFTHDSIFLGEDGPTHQPIEHVASLRLIPNLSVVRPATSLECLAAWELALTNKKMPTCLILTRQKLADVKADAQVSRKDILRGGYVFQEATNQKAQVVLVATGSELGLAVETKELLAKDGIAARVVSIPCLDVFEKQSDEYKNSVLLGKDVPTVVIEAGNCGAWYRLQKANMLTVGIDHFGASAPDHVLAEKFGFTGSQVREKIRVWLKMLESA